MAAPRVTNLVTGLPRQVNTDDPKELRRVLNRVLEMLHRMNGDIGDNGDRYVTYREYSE